MVSGLTIVATSSSACLPSFLPISARVLRSAVGQSYAALELVVQKTILCEQVFNAQQKFLVYRARDVR